MAGISSKAAGKLENRKQYNGIEHTTDLDLNQYDAFFRTMDPQLGRWFQIDPKVDSMFSWSPYVSMFDNPVRFIDPLGDVPGDTLKAYHPAPKNGLPGFPEAGKGSYNKESKRWRWKLKDGSILEWDKKKGEVEKFDKTGKNHVGAFDPETGEKIAEGKPERTTPKIVGENAQTALSTVTQRKLTTFEQRTPYTQYGFLPTGGSPTQVSNAIGTGVAIYVGLKIVEGAATFFSGGTLGWTLAF